MFVYNNNDIAAMCCYGGLEACSSGKLFVKAWGVICSGLYFHNIFSRRKCLNCCTRIIIL